MSCLRQLLACTLLLVGIGVSAKTVTVTTEGVGGSRQEAVGNALVEAVRQVNGVSISANQLLTSQSTTTGQSDSDGSHVQFSMSQQQSGTIGAKSAGQLLGYSVLSSSRQEDGYHVVVRARIARYKTPGLDPHNRRRLAVIPFSSRLGQVQFFGDIDGTQLAGDLSEAVLAQLVQSRRFSILDRESWSALGAEQNLLRSANTPIAEKAKLGRTLGADYLFLGELLDANGGVRVHTQQLTGMSKRMASARLSVAYRIVVPATGQIKYADRVSLDIPDLSALQIQSRTTALNELSRRLIGKVLDRIYPMKIIRVTSPRTAVVNQGGSSLSIGDQLTLVALGERLRDPYDGESLGRVETPLGKVEVKRVDGKIAYVAWVGEDGGALKVGELVRLDEDAYGAGARENVPPPQPRTHGVQLPFDAHH